MNRKTMLTALFMMASLGLHAQQIRAERDELNMGQVLFRAPSTVEFKLRNTGTTELRIEKVLSDCGCTRVNFPINGIAPGAEFTVKATYDAKQLGHFHKQIGVYAAGGTAPVMLTLKGVVVAELTSFAGNYPVQLGLLHTDIGDIEFDDVNRGDMPVQKIHIYNSTDRTAEPVMMHLPSYLKAEIAPSRIAPGRMGVATVTLNSRLVRDLGLNQTTIYLGFMPGDKVSEDKAISVSTVLLPDFNQQNASFKRGTPVFSASATTLSLGRFQGKKRLRGVIEIENKGKSTLDIRQLQMFTAGIEVALNKAKIAPGEKAKLKITGVADLLRKVRTKPRVLMITNDPKQSKVIISIDYKL
uniref:DUF1573 domain-containing protein n=1 Tax=Prevotella sp. GTC17260 TaxID=3236796 RepID=A0AB33J9T9_9BACT